MSALLIFATSWTLLTLAIEATEISVGLRGALVSGLLAAMFGGTLLAAFEDLEDPSTQGPHLAIVGFFGVLAIVAAGLILPGQLQAAALPEPLDAVFERADLLFSMLALGAIISMLIAATGVRPRFPWRRR